MFYLEVLRYFVIQIILQISAKSSYSATHESLAFPTGRIVSYSSNNLIFTNFTNYFTQTANSAVQNYVVLNPDTSSSGTSVRYEYKFECNARYPVKWMYRGEGLPFIASSSSRLIGGITEFNEPEKYTFSSIMYMAHLEQLTGLYTCQKMDATELSISIYAYFPGTKVFFIETPEPSALFSVPTRTSDNFKSSFLISTTSLLTIESGSENGNFPETERNWSILPCVISTPISRNTVVLHKQMDDGRFEEILLNDTVSYNPFEGFRINTQKFVNPWGLYMCGSDLTVNKLIFKLVPRNESSYVKVDILESNPDNVQFRCRTSSKQIHIQQLPCTSEMDCNFLKTRLENSFIPKGITFSDRENEEFVLKCPVARHNYKNMNLKPALPVTGLFFCSAGRQNMDTLLFLRMGNQIEKLEDVTYNELQIESILELRANTTVYITGQNATFTCYGRTLFFSSGFVWNIEIRTPNGSAHNHFRFGEALKPDISEQYIGNTVRLFFPTDGSFIKSLTCYAPFWNSATDWGNVTLEFSSQATGLMDQIQIVYTFLPFFVSVMNGL